MLPVALTIAGSDPSGGAGLQADLKTFHRFAVYGEAVVTLITVQNTRGVTQVSTLDPELVAAQIKAVIDDIPPELHQNLTLKLYAVASDNSGHNPNDKTGCRNPQSLVGCNEGRTLSTRNRATARQNLGRRVSAG